MPQWQKIRSRPVIEQREKAFWQECGLVAMQSGGPVRIHKDWELDTKMFYTRSRIDVQRPAN